MSIDQLFGATSPLAWTQECARAVLISCYGLLLVRIAGRRVFGRWSAVDIVVAIVAGSNLSRALTGSAPLWGTLAATTLLMLLHWLMAQSVARSTLLSRLLEGRPIWLVKDGRVLEERRRSHSVSLADLHEALRRAGLERMDEARAIILEPSGNLIALHMASPAAET